MSNNNKSELTKISESVAKTISENVNNVLGILPQSLNFEFNRPKAKRRKVVRSAKAKPRTKVRAKVRAKNVAKKVKRAGVRLKKRAKTAITKARKPSRAKRSNVIRLRKRSSSQARAA